MTDMIEVKRPVVRRFCRAVDALFADDANWSVLDLDGAREFFEAVGFRPSKAAASVECHGGCGRQVRADRRGEDAYCKPCSKENAK